LRQIEKVGDPNLKMEEIICHFCEKQLATSIMLDKNENECSNPYWACLCGHLYHDVCKVNLENDVMLLALYCEEPRIPQNARTEQKFRQVFLEQNANGEDTTTVDDDLETSRNKHRDELDEEIEQLKRSCEIAQKVETHNWQIIANLEERVINTKLLDLKLNVEEWIYEEDAATKLATPGLQSRRDKNKDIMTLHLQETLGFYLRDYQKRKTKNASKASKMMANTLSHFKELCEEGKLEDSAKLCEGLVNHFEYASSRARLRTEVFKFTNSANYDDQLLVTNGRKQVFNSLIRQIGARVGLTEPRVVQACP